MRGALVILISLGSVVTALADTGPVRVIPGRAGVPVMINGRDASYGVVEGDWGLAKNVHVQPTIYGGWDRYIGPEVGHYYPSFGRQPGYGRVEIQPAANRVLPQPAESYYRSWSAQSAPPVQQRVPEIPPNVIIAPEIGGERGPHRFRN
jgi:hypothetical protein